MQLDSTIVDDDHIQVSIPITRSDVIHACDVYGIYSISLISSL